MVSSDHDEAATFQIGTPAVNPLNWNRFSYDNPPHLKPLVRQQNSAPTLPRLLDFTPHLPYWAAAARFSTTEAPEKHVSWHRPQPYLISSTDVCELQYLSTTADGEVPGVIKFGWSQHRRAVSYEAHPTLAVEHFRLGAEYLLSPSCAAIAVSSQGRESQFPMSKLGSQHRTLEASI